MTTPRPIVVLKLLPYPLHAGTIGIVRWAGRRGHDVVVVGERAGTPVAHSRYLTARLPLPTRTTPEALAQWLVDVVPAGPPPLLVPVDDLGSAFVQENAETLSSAYWFHRMEPTLPRRLIDKGTMAQLALEAEVPVPRHWDPQTEEELEQVLRDVPLPLVVKVRDPDRAAHTPGVAGVQIVRDPQRCRDAWTSHLVDGRPNCIVQEYVPGDPDSVWMINAYADADSRLTFASTGRKIRQWPPYTGATSLGICQRNDTVIALTQKFVSATGYRGILDVGWRYDARDGTYKLLDFNPRIGATFRLFVGERGTDVLEALATDARGATCPPDESRDGRRWLNDAYDTVTAGIYARDGRLSPTDFVRSRQGVDERVWRARDDMRPYGIMLRIAGRAIASHAAERGTDGVRRRGQARGTPARDDRP
jgi:predicted ATP-grasp superfamily ATP-dependent carboligase